MLKKKKIIISIISIVLVVVVSVTAGVLLYKDWPEVIQDFEVKSSDEAIRIMSFNIRCTRSSVMLRYVFHSHEIQNQKYLQDR